jgi:hypothetical protein
MHTMLVLQELRHPALGHLTKEGLRFIDESQAFLYLL